ncbi:hypothetical protein JCM10213v2_007287, partial [Rhodosporidiobolus nylandii]
LPPPLPVSSDVFRWSSDGKAILHVHTSQRLDTLTRFLQYGFTRIPVGELLSTLESSPATPEAAQPAVVAASEFSGFTHSVFWRDDPHTGPCDLPCLQPGGPKAQKGKDALVRKMAEGEGCK